MYEKLFAFALVELVFSLAPGPAVFLVISKSMRKGFWVGAVAAIGVIAVNILYFLLSAFGVGAALAAAPVAFATLKYGGAAYLTWSAIGIAREMHSAGYKDQIIVPENKDIRGLGLTDALFSAIAVQASSIKTIIIFLSIIPQFIDPSQSATPQFVVLCIISIIVELPVLLAYAFAASSAAKRFQSIRLRMALDGISALVLLGIAGAIVLRG
ncbi:LysE family translocator [Phyllobacterium sp. P30BS-XVII]|uniref:LysE family translocator n=1 Tax=Phyllobacterium sp. P30BS-XVII TaxID=2587046 RepID=UPI000DD5C7C0|nr:LysE family translocator [Phyllobacterium sp. P30BS-XVII]MBA8902087.1 homoserine/homoserine lactone efflux protein [Phyllobacterium sp. P30BS-XVII]